jgi:polysaccharide export outer membrane protein
MNPAQHSPAAAPSKTESFSIKKRCTLKKLHNSPSAYMRLLLAAAGLSPLCACELPPVVMPNSAVVSPVGFAKSLAPTSAVVSEETQSLSPAQIAQLIDSQSNQAYVLGPTDTIQITVYLHPELSLPSTNNVNTSDGVLITGDGTVDLPLIGSFHIGGMTLAQAGAALTAAYTPYINHADVSVQLTQAQSLRYYLLGAFVSPGVKTPVHQLSLLEALALGGSVDIPQADLYQAYVAQGSTKLPVDLHALLVDGDLSQNITLASGDSIVVPTAANENAFVFGAVGKPGPIAFQSGALSLLQALSGASMDLTNFTNAGLSDVRIIRGGGRSAQFLVVNANLILAGQAAPFALQPGDIVFVPPTAVASWNQVLQQLLPSLQTVTAGLSPFVDIKYLTGH